MRPIYLGSGLMRAMAARQIGDKAARIAAHLLEVSEAAYTNLPRG